MSKRIHPLVAFLSIIIVGGLTTIAIYSASRQEVNYNNLVIPKQQVVKSEVTSSTPPNANTIQSIRSADLKEFLVSVLSLKEKCQDIEGSLLQIGNVEYGDLNGDGNEDAIINARSCYAGTGGYDVLNILTISSQGKIIELPWDTPRIGNADEKIKRKASLGIQNKKLIYRVPVYRDEDANCCPSGGTVTIFYEWRNNKFGVERIENPP